MANRDKQYQIGKWPADISINFQSPLVLDSISMLRNQQIICPKCEKKKIYVWQYYDYLIYKCSNCAVLHDSLKTTQLSLITQLITRY